MKNNKKKYYKNQKEKNRTDKSENPQTDDKFLKSLFQAMPQVIFEINSDGRITYVAPTATRPKYKPKDEILNKLITDLFSKNKADLFLNTIKKTLSQKSLQILEYSLMKNEQELWFEARVAPKTDHSVLAIISEITERKRKELALQKSENLISTILENMPGGFILVGDDYKIHQVNKRTCEITGYTHKELVGELCDIICPKGSTSKKCPIWIEGKEGFDGMETTVKCKNGRKNPVLKNAQRITIDGKKYILENFQDIADLKQKSINEKKLTKRIEAGLRIGNLAWWEMELPSGKVKFDDRKAELLGYKPEKFTSYSDFTQLIHSDDYDKTMDAMQEHLYGDAETYDVQYRIKTKKGDYKWFRDIGGITEKDSETGKIQVIGIVEDITERKEIEYKLKKSQEHFKKLFDLMVDPVVIVDKKGRFLEITQKMEALTGFKREDFIGKNFMNTKIATAKSKAIMIKNLVKRMMGMKVEPYEVDILNAAGEKIPFEVNASIIDYKGKSADLVAFRDLRKRKKAERKLKELHRNLKIFIDSSPDIYFMKDKEFKYILSNKANNKFFGRSESEIIGKTDFDLMPDKLATQCRESDVAAIKKKKNVGKIEKINGKIFKSLKIPILDKNKIIGIAGIIKDVTSQQKAQEDIKKFKTIADKAVHGNAILDKEDIIIYSNDSFAEMHNYSTEELIGKNIAILHPEEKLSDLDKINKSISEKGSYGPWEIWHIRKNGTKFPILKSGVLIKDSEGKPKFKTATAIDISERIEALNKLQEREKEMSLMLEKMLSAFVIFESVFDENGKFVSYRFIYINQAYERITGVKNEDVKGKTVHEVWPETEPEWIKRYGEVAVTGKSKSFELYHKPTKKLYYCNVYRPFDTEEKFCVIFEDITEQNKTEEIQKTIYNISKAMYTAEEMSDLYEKIRKNLGNVIDTTNLYIALYDETTDSISLPYNVDKHDNFETFPAGKTLTKYVINIKQPLLATREKIEELTEKGIIETIGSPAKVWLGVPLKVKDTVIGVIAVQSYDDKNAYVESDLKILEFISEQISISIMKKRAQENLQIIKNRLQTATSMLRHDMGNNLAAIRSAVRIYKKLSDKSMLDEIQKKIDESLGLIERQREQEKFLNSHSTLKEYKIHKVVQDLREDFTNITININGECFVFADQALYSVFTNLFNNAVNHGKADIIDVNITENNKNKFCTIEVKDNGTGILDKIKDKVFEQGFTYGKSGNTGIGLHIVKQTIEEYGGSIAVTDNKPKGTVFTINLRKVIKD